MIAISTMTKTSVICDGSKVISYHLPITRQKALDIIKALKLVDEQQDDTEAA